MKYEKQPLDADIVEGANRTTGINVDAAPRRMPFGRLLTRRKADNEPTYPPRVITTSSSPLRTVAQTFAGKPVPALDRSFSDSDKESGDDSSASTNISDESGSWLWAFDDLISKLGNKVTGVDELLDVLSDTGEDEQPTRRFQITVETRNSGQRSDIAPEKCGVRRARSGRGVIHEGYCSCVDTACFWDTVQSTMDVDCVDDVPAEFCQMVKARSTVAEKGVGIKYQLYTKDFAHLNVDDASVGSIEHIEGEEPDEPRRGFLMTPSRFRIRSPSRNNKSEGNGDTTSWTFAGTPTETKTCVVVNNSAETRSISRGKASSDTKSRSSRKASRETKSPTGGRASADTISPSRKKVSGGTTPRPLGTTSAATKSSSRENSSRARKSQPIAKAPLEPKSRALGMTSKEAKPRSRGKMAAADTKSRPFGKAPVETKFLSRRKATPANTKSRPIVKTSRATPAQPPLGAKPLSTKVSSNTNEEKSGATITPPMSFDFVSALMAQPQKQEASPRKVPLEPTTIPIQDEPADVGEEQELDQAALTKGRGRGLGRLRVFVKIAGKPKSPRQTASTSTKIAEPKKSFVWALLPGRRKRDVPPSKPLLPKASNPLLPKINTSDGALPSHNVETPTTPPQQAVVHDTGTADHHSCEHSCGKCKSVSSESAMSASKPEEPAQHGGTPLKRTDTKASQSSGESTVIEDWHSKNSQESEGVMSFQILSRFPDKPLTRDTTPEGLTIELEEEEKEEEEDEEEFEDNEGDDEEEEEEEEAIDMLQDLSQPETDMSQEDAGSSGDGKPSQDSVDQGWSPTALVDEMDDDEEVVTVTPVDTKEEDIWYNFDELEKDTTWKAFDTDKDVVGWTNVDVQAG